VFKDEINAKDNWYFIDINLNERNETKWLNQKDYL
jgi:hypothetical protein